MAAKSRNTDIENEVKESKAKPAKKDTVTIMVPMIEGEDPYINVGINGHYTQIKRGVAVEVSKAVAEVIQNSNMQMMAALEKQKEFEDQEFDWQ
jgi:hypothetical protein